MHLRTAILIEKKFSLIMAIVMVAMLAFGGTYAYFTSTTEETTSGAVTTARIMLKNDAAVTLTASQANILPGEDVTLKATITNDSTRDSFVFVKFAISGVPTGATLDFSKSLTGTDGTTWTLVTDTTDVYYMKVASSVTAVELNSTATFTATDVSENGTKGDMMGEEITVVARFASCQQGGDIADVAAAYAKVESSLAIA